MSQILVIGLPREVAQHMGGQGCAGNNPPMCWGGGTEGKTHYHPGRHNRISSYLNPSPCLVLSVAAASVQGSQLLIHPCTILPWSHTALETI